MVVVNGPCFRCGTFADVTARVLRHVDHDPSPAGQRGQVRRRYEHLYRAIIGDGNALAVELGLFRRTYNTLRPHQALDDRTPRQAYVTGTGTQ